MSTEISTVGSILRGTDIPLFPCYGGRKSATFDTFRDYRWWPVMIEPFAGSGYSSLHLGADQTFVGETQGMYWIWRRWVAGEWRLVEGWLNHYLEELAKIDRISTQSVKGSAIWQEILAAFPEHSRRSLSEPPSYASTASNWLLRRICFRAVGRTNAIGDWNVGPDPDKLNRLLRKGLDTVPPRIGTWHVGHGWEDCLRQYDLFGDKDKPAIALVDPGYYFPHELMPRGAKKSAMYPGHDPHDPSNVVAFEDCLWQLAKNPLVKRIVAWNHLTEAADGAARGVAQETGRSCFATDYGKLRSVANGRNAEDPAREYSWTFGEVGTR